MLAAYLICLVVGGVFVGLSVLSGLGKDVDLGHDADHAGGDVDHVVDHGGGLEGHHLEAHTGDHADLAEAAHAGRPRRWLPFLSLRFWTFGSFFFGLTGLALTTLASLAEPAAGLMALGAGLGGGGAAAAIVHHLRQSVGAPPERADWVGLTGELLLPLPRGGVSKIRVGTRERERELMVALADPGGAPLPKGTRVIILRLEADGRALVVPENAVLPAPRTTQAAPQATKEEVDS